MLVGTLHVAALLQGQHPTAYWTPLGKNTVRMVHTAPVEVPKGESRGVAGALHRQACRRLLQYSVCGRGSSVLQQQVSSMSTIAAAAGAKPDRDQVPGVKLKTENKKPIVGLAVHPIGGQAEACTAGMLLALHTSCR